MHSGENLTNIDVVLLALYKLGGVSKKIHTEYIVAEAYSLSKERFSWTLPEFRKLGYPDKTVARYALEDAKKMKLIKGRAGRDKGGRESEGWQFAPLGMEWLQKNLKRIETNLGLEKPISSVLPKQQAERFIKRLRNEKIFKLFLSQKSLDQASFYDFADMLNCSPDASSDAILHKFDLFRTAAISINDKEIQIFLINCEIKFKDILTP